MIKTCTTLIRALLCVLLLIALAKVGKAEESPKAVQTLSTVGEPIEPTKPIEPETSAVRTTRDGSITTQIPKEVLDRIPADDLVDLLHKEARTPKSVPEVIFDKQIIVPGLVFGSFVVIAFSFAYFSYRKRRELFLLVQEAIKSGHALPESFLESLEQKKKPTADSDLRKAVILIAFGISSIVILGTVASERALAALGILPLLLGLAYLLLWKWSKPRDSALNKPRD